MNIDNYRPLRDQILVRPDKPKEQTESGIWLPNTAKKAKQQGTVIKVGPGKKDFPMKLKEGDRVNYDAFTGFEIVGDDNTSYLRMRETEVLSVI